MRISKSNKLSIVITTGDPAGIGREVVDKALKNISLKKKVNIILVDEPVKGVKTGHASKISGRISYEKIKKGVSILQAIKHKRKALVTAPINKYSLSLAGVKAQGHTEILASLTGTDKYAMMFTKDDFKVVLVTRHIPLGQVPGLITVSGIVDTTKLFCAALIKYFKIGSPKIGVAGLNPHAGDNGSIGKEEENVIMPAISILRKAMPGITGPVPADVVFHQHLNGKLDGVVSMYHDQALAPFKMLHFDTGVNMTLGLPFVRTSPDHGTAYDIAGKGIASPVSMMNAIKVAIKCIC